MSGFGNGGYSGMLQDLIRQVQNQNQDDVNSNPPITPQPQSGVGPGEPQGGYPQYGQQGQYNALSQDMSRGYMGKYGFGGGMFGYSPYGNPFMQQQPPMGGFPYPGGQPPGMGGYGGFGGGYGGGGGFGYGGRYGGSRYGGGGYSGYPMFR